MPNLPEPGPKSSIQILKKLHKLNGIRYGNRVLVTIVRLYLITSYLIVSMRYGNRIVAR